MKTEADFRGVKIGDGACYIELQPTGEATEYGFPTLINVVAGPFTGSFRDAFVGDFRRFAANLKTCIRP